MHYHLLFSLVAVVGGVIAAVPINQIADGQIQAPKPQGNPIVQISDGQIQATKPASTVSKGLSGTVKSSSAPTSNRISSSSAKSTSAATSPAGLIFTYQTLSSGVVKYTTTSYRATASSSSARGSTPTHAATSYKLNINDLAYPAFSNITGPLADNSPGSNLPNGSTLGMEALQLIALVKNATAANCQTCKNALSGIAARMRVQQETLSDATNAICAKLSAFIPLPICAGLLKITSTDIGGIFPAMDMQGDDGQLLCTFQFGLCTLPAPPKLDLNTLFRGTKKPAPRVIKPSTKKPLNVFHISDYHLDLRYVAGAEANCTGPLCCRVFPYTNLSMPIQEPASIFGNYLCDTPEPLATSVFRNVPKVTGLDWADFSMGIFTGDLVSHDIWELTEEYVLANELESYQQFFNGMGGVKMYPTLGNHDSYPHAFTAWPYQDQVLPKNASYPVQQLYNYRNVSAAWANYGWLSHADAQQVVNSGLGIYRTVTKEGLVIISLNSDAWYYFNLYSYINANKVDPIGIFAILIDYLLAAEAANQAVWIIQHVNVGGSTTYEALPAATDLYYQIIDRFSNTIRATFFGHTHSDEFGVFYSGNGTVQDAAHAVNVAYIMPSVTTYTNLNAAFRYYTVDPDTFDILDSITYYSNISNTNAFQAAGDAVWQLEYSARKTYDPTGTLLKPGMPLTPAFWHNVTQEIYTNQTMFETYTDLRSKKFRPYAAVTGAARNATLCGLRSMSIPIFETCLMTMKSITSFL